jgi:hypothetical protein
MEVDLGDVVAVFNLRVKGLRRFDLLLRVGVPYDTSPADRVVKPPPYAPHPGKVDLIMDLQADKAVPLSVVYTDEVGNPTTAPVGATVAYTVDDPTLINLTDNGDGTAVAAAVGALGTANVHVVATFNGTTLTGDLQIVVVAGLAERLNVVAGEPVEVTPDVP